MSESKTLALTAEDLKSIVAAAVTAAVAESRKPAPLTEREQSDLEFAQQSRKELSASVLEEIETKRFEQKVCSHKHATGESHCVHILDGNYILCQKCQGKVRPGTAPDGYKGGDIYDTRLFNQLFQELQRADIN